MYHVDSKIALALYPVKRYMSLADLQTVHGLVYEVKILPTVGVT